MNERVKEALLSVSENVFLFTAKGNQNLPYIVYGVDGENHLFASDRRAELCDAGYVDLFTKDELAGVAFYLNSVQFEEQTDLLHYEWRWESV